tara:strand:- start:286 stop:3627 length:3342 start_codon:yes stop_codon:yes gene_type:complete
MAKKKSTAKKAKEVVPKEKKGTKKRKKEKVDKSDDVKGRIVVSQRERDEIDAVIDAFWAFIAAVKRAPKVLLLAGIFLTITGATFAGWPQEAFDVEFHGKSGLWVLTTKSDFDMARNADGDYVNFDVDDRVWLEGELNEIKYYGPVEELDFPILGTDANENPSVAPGDSYQKVEEAEFDDLFSSFGDSNNSSINYANGENLQATDTTRKEFSDTSLDSALFNDVTFTDVIFSNLTLSDTFFVDCTFERVLFDNVLFNRAVFTNSSFNTIFFNGSHIEGSRFESSKFTNLWMKDSRVNNTNFDKTDILGSKWSYSSLENGTFQRGEIDVVIFRSLMVDNFVLISAEEGRVVKNVLDVPNTATFDFTYITIGTTEVKVLGDLEDRYPLGQNLLVSTVVRVDGIGAGVEGSDGQWVGDISGEGFTTVGSSVKRNLSYEYMVATDPDGPIGFIVMNLFRMEDGGIDTTLEYTIFFNLLTFVGLVLVVYAVGTINTIFALLKFFSPFFMTVGYFILLKTFMDERVFLELSGLMFLYFVPPMGKESVIPIGIAQGIPWATLAFSIAFVDIVVCLFLIWNFDLAKKLPFVGSGIKRVQLKGASILESMPWVERLTFFGIVIFVMIPFQGSGAFAGTILGRAVGLSVPAVLGAVTLGALVGSCLIALSIVKGLGFLSYLAPLQLAGFIIFIMVCATLYFVYRHWDELSMEEFTQTLGLHREGVIGAPLTAAGGLVGSAGGTVIKAAEGTGKSVIKAAGDTGRIITKTTSNIVGSFVDSFTDDQYDYMSGTTKELDSGVLVSVPDGARNDVVVTGGAGFIGSHLVDRLVKRDEHVVVLDNFSSGNLEFLFESIENITVIDVDLLNDDFDNYLKGCKIVYHLAANPEVQLGITEPEVMQEQNVDVTEKVLQAMERTGCSRIVFTSTSTVYGDAKKIPTPENSDLKPISAYGQSKLDAEKLIEKYCEEHKFMGVSYRFANCVGPRSNHGVTFDFVNKLRDNPKELEILGDGKQNKSYFHVEDCISAMLAKTPRELCKPGEFMALNVGSKDSIDVVTLANEVCKAMKLKDVEYKFTGGVDGGRGWKGDVKKMRLDIKKMKSHGWDPQFTSRKAIADTAKWLDENS